MIVSDKYLLNLLREIVSERAGYRCEKCLAFGKNFDPHHVYSREYKSIRYDPLNGVWLCVDCHRYAHTVGERFFINELVEFGIRPPDWPNELITRKNLIVKFNNAFRIEWKAKLQEELGRLAA